MRWIFVLLFALVSSPTAFAAEVPQSFVDCLERAKRSSPRGETALIRGDLSLSDRDSASASCFFQLNVVEGLEFKYRRCFEVAALLPKPYVQAVAAQSCFDAWHETGTLQNCYWAADQVTQLGDGQASMKFRTHSIRISYGLTIPIELPAYKRNGFLRIADHVGTQKELRAQCTSLDEGVFKPRARLKALSENTITRVVAARPLTEAEQKVCDLEVPALVSQYERLGSSFPGGWPAYHQANATLGCPVPGSQRASEGLQGSSAVSAGSAL